MSRHRFLGILSAWSTRGSQRQTVTFCLSAIVVIYVLGLKSLEVLVSYSFALGAWHGLSDFERKVAIARIKQVIAALAFVGTQLLGGTFVRYIAGSERVAHSQRWTAAISLLNFMIGFAVFTVASALAYIYLS